MHVQGYSVGPSQLTFQITANVTTSTAGAKSTTQSLILSPSTPSGLSTNSTVYAQLLGDLASYNSMPSFEYSYLMIPQYPGEPGTSCSLISCCHSVSQKALNGQSSYEILHALGRL